MTIFLHVLFESYRQQTMRLTAEEVSIFNVVTDLVILSVEQQRSDYICRLELTVFCIQRLGFRIPDFRSI